MAEDIRSLATYVQGDVALHIYSDMTITLDTDYFVIDETKRIFEGSNS